MNRGSTSSTSPGLMMNGEREGLTFSKLPVNQHLVGGISGGVVSTIVLHPLDLLKVRLSVNDSKSSTRPHYHGLRNAAKTIFKEEGARGLYRGITPNCVGSGASWGFYFCFYNSIKDRIQGSETGTHDDLEHFLAAMGAGIASLFITSPFTLVRTRLCCQYADKYMTIPSSRQYTGIVDAFRKVYKHEGFKGLYTGLVPGLFNVSQGAFQIVFYDKFKYEYSLQFAGQTPSPWDYVAMAAASKLLATSLCYPFQYLRARLQDQHKKYSGLREVVNETWRCKGFRGFYSGITAHSIHVVPNICIVFAIQEFVSS